MLQDLGIYLLCTCRSIFLGITSDSLKEEKDSSKLRIDYVGVKYPKIQATINT